MNLTRVFRVAVLAALVVVPVVEAAQTLQVTPAMQGEIDKQKQVVAGWAADPTIVGAVKEQNAGAPIPGMDNAKWKSVRRTDPLVTQFRSNAAGQFLRAKLAAGGGIYNEAFLSAARGEKVGFAEKTTSYIHLGAAKFDVPFTTSKAWQGKPEFDESSQTYALQVSVPVLDSGKPIGVLVVGVSLGHLEKLGK
jgi:hypothetical protein